jgi:hypothetical protein
MFEQVPTLPRTLHTLHSVLHVVLQQTVSTQLPEAHSKPVTQVVPFCFGAHLPTEQMAVLQSGPFKQFFPMSQP